MYPEIESTVISVLWDHLFCKIKLAGNLSGQVQIHVKCSPVSNQSSLQSQGGLSKQVVLNTGFTAYIQWIILGFCQFSNSYWSYNTGITVHLDICMLLIYFAGTFNTRIQVWQSPFLCTYSWIGYTAMEALSYISPQLLFLWYVRRRTNQSESTPWRNGL